MEEKLVEWTLVSNQKYLEDVLGRRIKKKLARQFALDSGKLDLLYEEWDGKIVVIELKLSIRTPNDWNSVINQLSSYLKEIREMYPHCTVEGVILTALENSREPTDSIARDLEEHGISAKSYSIDHIEELYSKTIERLIRNSGFEFKPPTSIGVASLYYIKRLVGAFENSDILELDEIMSWMADSNFGHAESRVNNLYLLAKSFGLMDKEDKKYVLTDRGKKFRDAVNGPIRMQNLSGEQKRILLESLLERVDTPVKSLIFWFLRFVSITGGEWVPRSSTQLSDEECRFINLLMGIELNPTSARDMLYWASKFCEELELVRRVEEKQEYDKVVLTSLGSRVHTFLENLLLLKREMIQIPIEAY